MAPTSREVRLAARPTGLPKESDFELVETSVPEPGDGEVLVRNLYMSVDPYMRWGMTDAPGRAAPFELGAPLQGGAVGRVVRSHDPTLAAGDLVSSTLGWREYFVTAGSSLNTIDPGPEPPSYYLGLLGMPGLTAYAGVLDVAQIRAGETVFVSAAAGAVGMAAGQIAKVRGCRVVGSTGSAEKVDWLVSDLGFDAAFNYKERDLEEALSDSAPEGIDAYFDNVGYDHLQAAINHLNEFGRVAVCGSIAGYNRTDPVPGPNNLALIVRKSLTIRGFRVSDYAARQPDFLADMKRRLAEGAVRNRETVVEGIERAPQAFMGLFDGVNVGKMIVKLGPEEGE